MLQECFAVSERRACAVLGVEVGLSLRGAAAALNRDSDM